MAKTILIVDDSESIREVVNFTLENEGYNVLVAVDGKDALKFLDGTIIDLIITGWIIKPFVPAKLIEALNKVLR